MISKENKEKLLRGVIEIAKADSDFKNRLLHSLSATPISVPSEIGSDIKDIKKFLQISKKPTLNYELIKDPNTRLELQIDNMHMSNAYNEIRLPNETVRLRVDGHFLDLCTYAWFQIENLLNYYFHIRYKDIESIRKEIQYHCEGKYNPSPNAKINTIGDIEAYYKIKAICHIFREKWYPKDKQKKDGSYFSPREATLDGLRLVRNKCIHKSMIIFNESFLESDTHINKFLNWNDKNTIIDSVKHLYNAICCELT